MSLARPIVAAPLLLLLGAGLSAWYATRSLPFSDEGAVLTAAARILRGAVFYRDVDAYWAPGSAYLVSWFMAWLGEHLSVARGLAAVLFCVTLLGLYAASLRLLDPARAALFGLSLLCLKLVGWPAFSIYLYSDVAFAFACVAIALLLPAFESRRNQASPRLLAAGLCVGLASVSKQNLGVYMALAAAALLWRSGPRALGAFVVGASVPVLAMALYFAVHGLFGDMIASAVLRPFTGYLPTSGISFTPMLAWWETGSLSWKEVAPYLPLDLAWMAMRGHLPGAPSDLWWLVIEIASRALYTSVVFAFAWLGWRVWRGRDASLPPHQRALHAYGLLALAGVASAFPRADFFHVTSVYPLVLLLLFASVQPAPSPTARRPWPEALAVGLALLACTGLALLHRSQLTHEIELPRARVWVDPSEAWVEPLVEVVAAEVPPGEPLFVHGHEAHYYFLSGRFYPWPFSQLYPGQVGGDDGRPLAQRLLEVPPRLVIRGIQEWPGVPPLRRHASAVGRTLAAHFQPDTGFFVRHVPDAAKRPPRRVVAVLRPRSGPQDDPAPP